MHSQHRSSRMFTILLMIVAVIGTLSAQPVIAAAPDPDMDGVWHGAVVIPDGPTLEINLQFYKSEEGEDRLFIIVPEQDAVLVIEDLTLGNDSISFTSEEAGLTFEGALERGKRIEGTLTQQNHPMPVNFVLGDSGEDN